MWRTYAALSPHARARGDGGLEKLALNIVNMAPRKCARTAAAAGVPTLEEVPTLVEQLAGTSRARDMSRLRLANLSKKQLLEFAVDACESSPELKNKADALVAEAPLASTHQDAHILRETSTLSRERNAAVAKLQCFVEENSAWEGADSLEQRSRRQAVYTLLDSTRGAMQALVGLLDKKTPKKVVRDAVWLLHNECVRDSENFKDELVKVGAAEALVALLESKDENIAADAAGLLGDIMFIDPTDSSRGQDRVREVREAGALPALDRMLANGTHPAAVTMAVDNMLLLNTGSRTAAVASRALFNMVNSGAPIEWVFLKYFAGVHELDGVRGSPPTQFPYLMAALRELSEEFRGEANKFAALFGGRASGVDARLQRAMTIADSINDRKGFFREGDYIELVNALAGPSN
eukprot:scaffold33449_cov45-Phaeocystis_antarctica.AAC.3